MEESQILDNDSEDELKGGNTSFSSAWSVLDEEDAAYDLIEQPVIERQEVEILQEDKGFFGFF